MGEIEIAAAKEAARLQASKFGVLIARRRAFAAGWQPLSGCCPPAPLDNCNRLLELQQDNSRANPCVRSTMAQANDRDQRARSRA